MSYNSQRSSNDYSTYDQYMTQQRGATRGGAPGVYRFPDGSMQIVMDDGFREWPEQRQARMQNNSAQIIQQANDPNFLPPGGHRIVGQEVSPYVRGDYLKSLGMDPTQVEGWDPHTPRTAYHRNAQVLENTWEGGDAPGAPRVVKFPDGRYGLYNPEGYPVGNVRQPVVTYDEDTGAMQVSGWGANTRDVGSRYKPLRDEEGGLVTNQAGIIQKHPVNSMMGGKQYDPKTERLYGRYDSRGNPYTVAKPWGEESVPGFEGQAARVTDYEPSHWQPHWEPSAEQQSANQGILPPLGSASSGSGEGQPSYAAYAPPAPQSSVELPSQQAQGSSPPDYPDFVAKLLNELLGPLTANSNPYAAPTTNSRPLEQPEANRFEWNFSRK